MINLSDSVIVKYNNDIFFKVAQSALRAGVEPHDGVF